MIEGKDNVSFFNSSPAGGFGVLRSDIRSGVNSPFCFVGLKTDEVMTHFHNVIFYPDMNDMGVEEILRVNPRQFRILLENLGVDVEDDQWADFVERR